MPSTVYREDHITPVAASAFLGEISTDTLSSLHSVPSIFYPANPANGHGALTKVNAWDIKLLSYVGVVFSVFGITQACDQLHEYWLSENAFSKREKAIGTFFAFAQLIVGSLLFTASLGLLGLVSIPVVMHVLPIVMMAYAAFSAVRYLVEMGRSIYLAFTDKEHWKEHAWNAAKYFVAAILNGLLLTNLFNLFIPMLEKIKRVLLSPSLDTLKQLGGLFTNFAQAMMASAFLVAVGNFIFKQASDAWKVASDPLNAYKELFESAKSAFAKCSRINSRAARYAAYVATVIIQTIRVLGKVILNTVSTLVLGVPAFIRKGIEKALDKKSETSMFAASETSQDGSSSDLSPVGSPSTNSNSGVRFFDSQGRPRPERPSSSSVLQQSP